ncbi:MAG: imidazoleglycerol-phosphate dehydratase [Gemmatimonadetes bacterium]|nr:MAG: imidazoleglycerol-phosphate dehydratase [Gemmatimonadota bacterium]
MSRIERETRETRIALDVQRGEGRADVETDDPFLTHMLVVLCRYAGLDLTLRATGDLLHHLVEDVAIALGTGLADEVPATATRYGAALIPMDDALVEAAIDVGGRAYYEGGLPSGLYEHFLQSLAMNLGATLHVRVLRGRDRHHVVEAAVKATGLALRQALGEGGSVFSTKGSVRLERKPDGVLDEPGLDAPDATGGGTGPEGTQAGGRSGEGPDESAGTGAGDTGGGGGAPC